MQRRVLAFFILAFALTWTIGGLGLLLGKWFQAPGMLSPSKPLYYLAGYAVSLAGIGLTIRYAGWDGLGDLAGG